MDKKSKILVILDVIGLILSIVGVFFLTIMFKIDNSIFRYMFLLGDLIIFVIFIIYKTNHYNYFNYTALGDGYALGINSYGDQGYGYSDFLRDRLQKEKKLNI